MQNNKKSNNNDIPLSKIHQGFHLHENLIEDFLKTSRDFLESKQYEKSILLSIFAWEEMSKLSLLAEYMKNQWKDIPYNEWKKRTNNPKVHSFKLTDMNLTSKKRLRSKSKEELEEMKMIFEQHGLFIDIDALKTKDEDDKAITTFKKLNEVKKLILYNHWNGENWISFTNITKKYERKIMAEVLFELIKSSFFSLINIKMSGKIKTTDDVFNTFLEYSHKTTSFDFTVDREIMDSVLDKIERMYYNIKEKS